MIKILPLPSHKVDAMLRKRIEKVMQDNVMKKAEFSRQWGMFASKREQRAGDRQLY